MIVMLVYSKTEYELNEGYLDKIADSLKPQSVLSYSDRKRGYIEYRKLKESLEMNKTKGKDKIAVVIPSFFALGKTFFEINQEIQYLQNHADMVLVYDLENMRYQTDFKKNKLAFSAICDYSDSLRDKDVVLKVGQSKLPGRKYIDYPPDWEKYYKLWQSGEITARDFMKKVNLKKGTFYHLVSEYKSILEEKKYG